MSMILNATQMGEGEPLVLLHGLFGAARNLGVLSRGLSGKARVITMDLRNHGESPHGLPMDFVTMAADVAETLASLGIGRVKLAGHSLGGKTAMALALTRPELVERVAVMDIAPIAYDHDYDDYVAAMLAIELRPDLARAEAEQVLAQTVKAAPMRAFLLNNLVLGANPHWRVGLKEIQAAMPDMLNWVDPPGAQPFAGPALFLTGAESTYVGPEADGAIRRLFPNAVRKEIAGAAHWLHADKPAEVLASLREFFGL
ncbi:MAG: alpha/beta fold hydrolase [Acidocella sp.]|jgi:esterase|nr:alpha/beta fold hydrolase [Acidocella sp.]